MPSTAPTVAWGRILPYLRPHLPVALASSLAILATAIATLGAVPVVRGAAAVFAHPTLPALNRLVLLLITVYAAKGLFTWLANWGAAWVSLRTVADLRTALFAHLQTLDLAYFERRASGDLVARLVADVNLLRDALTVMASELAPSLLIVVVAIGYLFHLNVSLASAALLGLPLVGWALSRFADRLRHWSVASQGHAGDLTGYLGERLAHMALVKGFAREAHEVSRFDGLNLAHFRASLRGARVQALQTPVVGVLQIVAIAAVLWLGGYEIMQGRLAVPDLLAFAAAVGVCVDPVLAISNAVGKIQQASGAMARVFEVMDASPSLVSAPEARRLERIEGDVRFEAVSFAYEPTLRVLTRLDLAIPAGSVVALVGSSGAGKSTVIKLLQRFYDPTGGRITLDGVDLRELDLGWWRSKVGVVSQEPVLFAGTIAENLRYGRLDATDEEVEAAARAANAHGFVSSLADGYGTVLGERGVNLSGGQRQRLAIARALLRDPRLLILDEATSALDSDSERLVQEALEHLMQGRTTLVVAHRLSTVQRADRIVTLADGGIVEAGSHHELLAAGGLYASWYEHQTRQG